MNTRIAIAWTIALLTAVPAFAGIFRPAPENGVPDIYIVVLRNGVAAKPGAANPNLPRVAEVAQSLGRAHGGKVEEVWEHALRGFVVRMPEARARKLADDERVLAVEQNFSISTPVGDCYVGTAWQDTRSLPSSTFSPQTLSCIDPDPLNDTSASPPACKDNWGLDRIDQVSAGRNSLYSFPNNGANIHVYVMDTGIRWAHREFTNANGFSRVFGGVDARTNPVTPGNSVNTDDCHGHGTHVAGIIAGRTYGVAKDAVLHPVRTISCVDDQISDQQFIDNTIRGLNWIVNDVVSKRSFYGLWPSVINWSGGNHPNFTGNIGLRTAVQNVANNDVILVQAAGNRSPGYDPSNPALLRDACDWSFGGSVPKVIVAGGMNFSDGRWTRRPLIDPEDARYCGGNDCGSNAGSCIDIWAPAEHIIASSYTGNDFACRLSGTSMAAPHVAGVIALYLTNNPAATPDQVERALRSRGTWGALQSSSSHPNSIGDDSDNVVLYSHTTSTGDTAPVASFTFQCPGRQCTLNAAASSDDVGITSYQWRFGDGTTGSGVLLQHTFPANFTGPVVLKVTDGTGKTDHLRQTVTVSADAPPTASFFTASCTGLTCTFDSSASSDDQIIATRSWDFGDGTTGSGTLVTHSYAVGGTYTAYLTVTDNAGQTGTDSESVTVALPPPPNLLATATGATVTIQWTTVAGADGYQLERKTTSAAWQVAQIVDGGATSSANDVPSAPNGVVLYRVKARSGTAFSDPSNSDVAYAAPFTDDPIGTPMGIRAEHVTELRRAVNSLRDICGSGAIYGSSALDPNALRAQPIDDGDFTTLMQNVNLARAGCGLSPWSFTPPPPSGAGPISRTHMADLRNAVK